MSGDTEHWPGTSDDPQSSDVVPEMPPPTRSPYLTEYTVGALDSLEPFFCKYAKQELVKELGEEAYPRYSTSVNAGFKLSCSRLGQCIDGSIVFQKRDGGFWPQNMFIVALGTDNQRVPLTTSATTLGFTTIVWLAGRETPEQGAGPRLAEADAPAQQPAEPDWEAPGTQSRKCDLRFVISSRGSAKGEWTLRPALFQLFVNDQPYAHSDLIRFRGRSAQSFMEQ